MRDAYSPRAAALPTAERRRLGRAQLGAPVCRSQAYRPTRCCCCCCCSQTTPSESRALLDRAAAADQSIVVCADFHLSVRIIRLGMTTVRRCTQYKLESAGDQLGLVCATAAHRVIQNLSGSVAASVATFLLVSDSDFRESLASQLRCKTSATDR